MKHMDFNESTELPRYSYTRSPVNERAFLIMLQEDVHDTAEPVGDYTVLDREEDLTVSEKKVMNLISLLNEKPGKLIQVDEADGRTHFQVISNPEVTEELKVMFYTQKGEGVSKENALFRVKSDDKIWNETGSVQ